VITTRNYWALPLVAAGLLALSACDADFGDWGPSDRFKADFHETHALEPGGTLSLENFNGSVEITSWNDDHVEINGTKYASQRAYLDDMKIEVGGTDSAVHIRTIRPSISHCNCGARYTIRVPKRVTLDEIVSSNGGIQIEGIQGAARLRTSNGSIRVENLTGDLRARTSNSSIEIREMTGNVNVHTSNGHIDAEVSNGSFEAETSNSKIEAVLANPSSSWPVKLNTSNGGIDLTLKASKLPDVRAGTSNSSITLHVPATADARVRATTSSHNSIDSDFSGLMAGGDEDGDRRHRRSDIDGKIGQGGPLIELSTSNGSIHILKL